MKNPIVHTNGGRLEVIRGSYFRTLKSSWPKNTAWEKKSQYILKFKTDILNIKILLLLVLLL